MFKLPKMYTDRNVQTALNEYGYKCLNYLKWIQTEMFKLPKMNTDRSVQTALNEYG